MKSLALLMATALVVSTPAVAQPAQTAPAAAAELITVIHAGTLIAEPGRPPMRNASVVVRGRRVIEVRPGFAEVPGARVVDLRTSTVMPGLIDSHVHLRGLDDPLRLRLEAAQRDFEDEAYTALGNAKRTLLAGSLRCAISTVTRG